RNCSAPAAAARAPRGPRASAVSARLFGVAALLRAAGEHRQQGADLEPAQTEADQEVIEDVGGFVQNAVVGFGGEGAGVLVRLLAHLLADLFGAAVEEAAGVAALGGARRALAEDALEGLKEGLGLDGLALDGAIRTQATEEAARTAGVTGGTLGIDEQDEGVGVAVGVDGVDAEDVAAALTLRPERAAAPAEEGGVAGAERLLERFAIHVRDHAHLAGQAILSHGRHEAGLGVELEVHGARERSRALRHCLTARPEDGVVPSNARALERHPPSARNGWERAKRKTAARAGPAVATLGASAPAAYGGRRGVVQCEEGPGPRVS